jgi:hypothetical protein
VATTNTTRSGVTKISGHLILPDNAGNAIRCRNAGSTANWTLDVSNLSMDAPVANRNLRIDALSGADPKLISPVFRGVAQVPTTTTSNAATVTINFPWVMTLPSSAPLIQLSGQKTSANGVKVLYGVFGFNANILEIIVNTVEANDFNTVENLPVVWSMQFYDS